MLRFVRRRMAMPSFLELLIGGAVAGIGFSLGSSGVQEGRPLVRGAIRGVLMATERVREMAAGMGENFEDLVAEAKAEMQAEAAEAASKK